MSDFPEKLYHFVIYQGCYLYPHTIQIVELHMQQLYLFLSLSTWRVQNTYMLLYQNLSLLMLCHHTHRS